MGRSYFDIPTGQSQLFSENSSQLLAKSGGRIPVPQYLSLHLFQKVTSRTAGSGTLSPASRSHRVAAELATTVCSSPFRPTDSRADSDRAANPAPLSVKVLTTPETPGGGARGESVVGRVSTNWSLVQLREQVR